MKLILTHFLAPAALLSALSLLGLATGINTGTVAQAQPAEPAHAHEHDDEHANHAEGDGHADHAAEEDEATHDEHADEGDGHEDHDGEEAAEAVMLSPKVLREFGIQIQRAEGSLIEQTVRLPGEVLYNSDRIAKITPSVTGITQRINVSVGDRVEAGQVLAVLSSRELAATRADYLASLARLSLAQSNLESQKRLYQSRLDLAQMNVERDRRLFEQKVGSERSFLESKQRLEELRVEAEIAQVRAQRDIDEAEIAVEQAETSLHALGLNHEQIERTDSLEHAELNEYELVAPLSGMVTERQLTIGEVVQPVADAAPFVVADLSTVWVNLTVYQQDLAHVRPGQQVLVRVGHGIPDAQGKVAFISPALDESTRTAYARIVLDNPERDWRPGLFIEGKVEIGHDTASVAIPRTAVIAMDDRQVVFIETEAGLEPRPVRLGRGTKQIVEVLEGLRPGDRYAATGVLTLKSQMNSAALEHAGHAH